MKTQSTGKTVDKNNSIERAVPNNGSIRLLLCIISIILVISCTLFLINYFSEDSRAMRADLKMLTSEKYDTVFLSMFPTDTYDTEDFSYFRGETAVRTDWSIPSCDKLEKYMDTVAKSGNNIQVVYMGIDPEKIDDLNSDTNQLVDIIRKYPSVTYKVILPYYNITYWQGLSDEECTDTLNKYKKLTNSLFIFPNVSLYMYNEEWLVCNPANYLDGRIIVNKDIAGKLYAHCDTAHDYVLNPDNIGNRLEDFHNLIVRYKDSDISLPDMSDTEIIFFGDSIIGNFTDSSSVPGVVNGLTNSKTYNLGYGGNCATDNENDDIALVGIVNSFIAGDNSRVPLEAQTHTGINDYNKESYHPDKKVFVINYGLNDYFVGNPIASDNTYDPGTFCGAFRSAIDTLIDTYPDCRIIILTPNYTSYFDEGNEIRSERGNSLDAYVEALKAIADEYEKIPGRVYLIDNHSLLGIDKNNFSEYLLDGCHPNERTRFIMGTEIADLVSHIYN